MRGLVRSRAERLSRVGALATDQLLLLAGVGVEVDPRGEDAAHDSKEKHRFIE